MNKEFCVLHIYRVRPHHFQYSASPHILLPVKSLIQGVPNPKTSMFPVSSCVCLCRIFRSQVQSLEWGCSCSSACSNYIWVIDNFSVYQGATDIGCLTIVFFFSIVPNGFHDLCVIWHFLSRTKYFYEWRHDWLQPAAIVQANYMNDINIVKIMCTLINNSPVTCPLSMAMIDMDIFTFNVGVTW